MGFLGRLFGPSQPRTYAPPSDAVKQAIMLLGMQGDFDGLANSLKSKNPHVRAFATEAVLFASQVRSTGGGQFEISDGAQVAPAAVRLLIPLLDDSDDVVRKAAERALESVGARSGFARGTAQQEAAGALEEYRVRNLEPSVVDGGQET